MSIDDFNKIDVNLSNREKDSKKSVDKFIKDTDDLNLQTIQYYMLNMDELIDCLNESYFDMVNSKLEHDFKMDKLQTTIDWGEENNLREVNNLPKVTTQKQRDSVINLKVKNMKIHMEACELKYKIYNKIFNFINNNFELLENYYLVNGDNGPDVDDNMENGEN